MSQQGNHPVTQQQQSVSKCIKHPNTTFLLFFDKSEFWSISGVKCSRKEKNCLYMEKINNVIIILSCVAFRLMLLPICCILTSDFQLGKLEMCTNPDVKIHCVCKIKRYF
ncbi:hypothetical protein XENOCAPTIV_028678 [Xenoophorus captivus]|uniref:Transmembrane protein n=1 Tax=Xenoophorus captivus TaxID=1517983 RepID=A0ABV0QF19_9TELE